MVTFNFYSFEERKPKHNQEIIYTNKSSSFGYELYEFRTCKIECVWMCIDEDGWINGDEVIFNEHEPQPDNTILAYLLENGTMMDENTLWCDSDDFYSQLGE